MADTIWGAECWHSEYGYIGVVLAGITPFQILRNKHAKTKDY